MLFGLTMSCWVRRALIVAPKTLLAQWRKELTICGLQHCMHELSPTAGQNERCLSGHSSLLFGGQHFTRRESRVD